MVIGICPRYSIDIAVPKAFYSFKMILFLITGICFKLARLNFGLLTR
jgi:hypothetical protein